jgi:RimJ/RimL family protein N-acetyltransferase
LIERLQTARLSLTPLGAGDLDDLVAMYLDPRVTATLGGVRTAEQTAQYLQTHVDHWRELGFGFWAARDRATGRFAGRGGLRRLSVEGTPVIEVGYGFLSEFWGQGLATELARESVRVAFEELKIPKLACFTLPTNRASQRVMEKVGFRYERDIIFADLPHVLYGLHRPGVSLRPVTDADLQILFEYQNDPIATQVASFPSRDRDAFFAHHHKILSDPTLLVRTILRDGEVAGSICCFAKNGRQLVGYWIGRAFWGQGIATAALRELLLVEQTRPLFAYVANTNGGSIRVLEKCGFVRESEFADEILMALH